MTQGDGVGEVGRRNKCQKRRVVEGWGVRDGKQNKRQTHEIVIQVDVSMCDASHQTGCHLHMMTKPLINTPSVIGCNTK